ncbi:MAG TPA: aspartate carbamoyltransferase catalytic subunit [Candidatus Hydrogenedens sp.]|nr:aspartate carbamoyltransferase catalytic subunit [Candidatus Hydrogenedens sp.]
MWKHKDLLGLQFLSREEILSILDMVPPFLEVMSRSTGIKKVPLLQGRVVVHWFHEPSTRTFASFDLAAKRLSADTLSISASSSSEKKGETLHDTLYNIEAMKTDILVVRHRFSGVPKLLADNHPSHVINAGDGEHEHPTQGLLDIFTMRQFIREYRQDPTASLEGVRVSIIGDIAHSRVARSNIWALLKLGAQVTLCGPQTLVPKSFEQLGVCTTTRLKEALIDTDIIYALRIQLERQAKGLFPSIREYVRLYRIDKDTIRYAPKHAVVMHPGPINRDIELATEIADSPRSLILQQVSHGVAVRMAVMHLLVNSQYNKIGVQI